MFIQIIEGTTSRPEALHERFEIWERDLMPDAIGYLGSTGGCTSSGDCIVIARFESRDAARRNSDRRSRVRGGRRPRNASTHRCGSMTPTMSS